jgi:predicted glycosyltransferase
VRVWVDISNSPQVLFFRPLIELLRERGHEVDVTTRDYAQTVELLELHGIPHEVVGPPHAGGRAWSKALTMSGRLRALRGWARRRSINIALSHASHEPQLVARSLGIPSSYAFDYEFARIQHSLGCRAARRVVVPDAIPQSRLDRLGAPARKVRRYPGIKEEYYLASFDPDERVLDGMDVDRKQVLAIVRSPADVALYHRHEDSVFASTLRRIGSDASARAIVLPRTEDQRQQIASLALPSVRVPARAVDALSLVALADLVVSGGGTMAREAAALGVPAYTTFSERLGAVDERLAAAGKLQVLTSPGAVVLEKRERATGRPTREPALLLDLLLSALES